MKIACIGSRDISEDLFQKLVEIGRELAEEGHQIVSGNAVGSDFAFASGANTVDSSLVTVYLPWRTYNINQLVPGNNVIFDIKKEWEVIAKNHHPVYDRLTQGEKKMMMRNVGIILNADIVMANLNHQKVGMGGTGHGWRVAKTFNKPRIDVSPLGNQLSTLEILEWLKKVEEKLENPLTNV